MTTIRERCLAILNAPDHYSASSLLMTASIAYLNAKHRLKRLCEEIAGELHDLPSITAILAIGAEE